MAALDVNGTSSKRCSFFSMGGLSVGRWGGGEF